MRNKFIVTVLFIDIYLVSLFASCVSYPPVTTQTQRLNAQEEMLARPSNQIKVMSFNIRYATFADGINAWEYRKGSVVDTILDEYPDLFGVQEAFVEQVHYLNEHLPEYTSIGEGRYGGDKGEFAAIFYSKEKFELLESDTFWLSPTPEKPSTGWDSSQFRPCTWGKFKIIASGKEFYYYNTHFDHKGSQARIESAKLINSKQKDSNLLAILTEDLNCAPQSEPIITLTDPNKGGFWFDSYAELSYSEKNAGTYHPFTGIAVSQRIDYILFTKNAKVLESKIINNVRDNNPHNRFPSDHFPVWALLEVKE